jgi:hypothetical protein
MTVAPERSYANNEMHKSRLELDECDEANVYLYRSLTENGAN